MRKNVPAAHALRAGAGHPDRAAQRRCFTRQAAFRAARQHFHADLPSTRGWLWARRVKNMRIETIHCQTQPGNLDGCVWRAVCLAFPRQSAPFPWALISSCSRLPAMMAEISASCAPGQYGIARPASSIRAPSSKGLTPAIWPEAVNLPNSRLMRRSANRCSWPSLSNFAVEHSRRGKIRLGALLRQYAQRADIKLVY